MCRLLPLLALCAALAAAPVQAGCYADYKAKQGDPMRLHYGVAELSQGNCSREGAKKALQQRLAQAGWKLLNIVSVFDDSGLAQRKDAAGEYFLRY